MQEDVIEQAEFAGKDVLEVGVGYGAFTFAHLQEARSILGIDPEPEAIESTIGEAPEHLSKPKYEFVVGDVREIDLGTGGFDVVVFSDSF